MWNVDLGVCAHAHTNTEAGHATVCAYYMQFVKLGDVLSTVLIYSSLKLLSCEYLMHSFPFAVHNVSLNSDLSEKKQSITHHTSNH